MISKTILLTGATGFLGSELLKFWVKAGHNVIVLKRSSSSLTRIEKFVGICRFYDVDLPEWEMVFNDFYIDSVVHVAANYGNKGEELSEVMESNLLFPFELLKYSIKSGVREFINTGSSLPKEINAYARFKGYFVDLMVSKRNEIHCVNIALEYFYGPGDDSWKFMSMVLLKLLENERSIDFTEGLQRRDFIFIADVVSAFDTVLNSLNSIESGQTISVGSGQSFTLRWVVELCKLSSGNSSTELNFGALANRIGEVEELIADTSKLEKLGWKMDYSLEDGLKEYIKFLKGIVN